MLLVSDNGRIVLRELSPEDAGFILELVNDPDWLRFIGDRNVSNLTEARRYIEDGPVRSYRKHRFGLWAVMLRDSGLPIGLCGFLQREQLEEADLGFAFLPAYRKQGYALESCQAALSYAASSLGRSGVLAITSPENQRSIRLLEKLGFEFVRTFLFEHEQRASNLYRKDLSQAEAAAPQPLP